VKELLLGPSLGGWMDPKKYCRRKTKPLKRKIKIKKIISSIPSLWSLWEQQSSFF
jgi:hypothetical protein